MQCFCRVYDICFVRENCVKIRVLASIPSLSERRMTCGGICSIFGNNVFLQCHEKCINEENEGKKKEKILNEEKI